MDRYVSGFLVVVPFLNSTGNLASVLKKVIQFNYIFQKVFAFKRLDLLARNEIKHD